MMPSFGTVLLYEMYVHCLSAIVVVPNIRLAESVNEYGFKNMIAT